MDALEGSGRENDSIPWGVQLMPHTPKAVEKVVQPASGVSIALLFRYTIAGILHNSLETVTSSWQAFQVVLIRVEEVCGKCGYPECQTPCPIDPRGVTGRLVYTERHGE